MNSGDLARLSFAVGAALAVSTLPARAQALGPVLALISHPVADYDAWKVIYDAAAPVRDAAGVTGAEIFRDPADPLKLSILHRFASVEAAQAFLKNPDLAAAMQKGGVTAPPSVIMVVAA